MTDRTDRQPPSRERHPPSGRASLFDPAIMRQAVKRQPSQARPPARWPATRSCSWSRSAASSPPSCSSATSARRTGERERLRRPGRRLAVVHRAVRQLRRGDGRGPGQGPGRHAAQGPGRDHRPASRPPTATIVEVAVLAARRSATWCVVVGRRGDPRRRRDRRGHRHRSTSRPSPASRRRSSASPAATARRSPAAPGCCPTRSSCASRPSPARPSSTG